MCIRDRDRMKHERARNTVDDGRATDAEGEAEHRGGDEAFRADESASGESDVIEHGDSRVEGEPALMGCRVPKANSPQLRSFSARRAASTTARCSIAVSLPAAPHSLATRSTAATNRPRTANEAPVHTASRKLTPSSRLLLATPVSTVPKTMIGSCRRRYI